MADNQPNDALLSYIRTRLKPKYKLGVLSNSGDDYLSQLLAPADAEIFDDIVLSFRHGVVKPESRSFELAAERLGVKPAECLFVDDSPSHCAGARQVGMQTILYKDFAQFKEDIEKIIG
jgi:HAD superfamily hydrolase (TIGR01509 family)